VFTTATFDGAGGALIPMASVDATGPRVSGRRHRGVDRSLPLWLRPAVSLGRLRPGVNSAWLVGGGAPAGFLLR
jgi:hypothetical protein